MVLNEQPVEKLDLYEDGSLEVHSIWDTLQGEGPYSGTPATFIRLTGCNLQCPACDTEYTRHRYRMSVDEIISEIKIGRDLIVITGGEPLRQNIVPLSMALMNLGKDVQVETNGTLIGPFEEYGDSLVKADLLATGKFTLVCSPKTPKINDKLAFYWVDAWKYVVQAGHVGIDGLPQTTLGGTWGVARPPVGNTSPIYIQPLDEKDPAKNLANQQVALAACRTFGYRLCLQLHKLVGLE